MSSESERNPVEALAEDFLARYRRGERPGLSEYTGQHPELAVQIRELFPALVMIEEAGVEEPATGRTGAPARLGEYRLLREVGRGGMGVVYEAEQEGLGRHVALKVLPAAANSVQLQRFRREARSAARLHHTNIVPVFEVGEDSGTHYYAMQLIRGQGLDAVLDDLRRLRGGSPVLSFEGLTRTAAEGTNSLSARLASGLVTGAYAVDQPGPAPDPESLPETTPPEAPACPGELSHPTSVGYFRAVARLGMQAAEALAYAHGQGILHRDIKPSNLLLDIQGRLWVTDFGLAKGDGDDLTGTGDIVGTLRYLPPERLHGLEDVRGDLYSLGLTLYELLTLRSAFDEADRPTLLHRIAHVEPPPPRRLQPRVPRDLETVVLKAIAKEPGRRYVAAAELAEDLRLFLADRPVLARRASLPERCWRWCRRNRAVAALAGSVALLLCVIAVVSTVAAVWLGHELRRSEMAEAAERTAHRDAQDQLCRAHLNEADALRRSRLPGQRLGSLDKLRQAVALGRELNLPRERFDEFRSVAISCLGLPDVQVVKEWDGWPEGSLEIAFDSAFAQYARADVHGNITIRRLADDHEVAHLEGDDLRVAVRFSPDGNLLGVIRTYHPTSPLKVWKLAGGRPSLVLHEPDCLEGAWDFRPDGAEIAVGLRDGRIRIYDLGTGRPVREWQGQNPNSLRYHPRLHRIAGCDWEQTTVSIYDTDTGQQLASGPMRNGWVEDWHPDGKSVIVASNEDLSIRLWNVETRQTTRVLKGHTNFGIDARVAPCGDLLGSTDWDGMVRFWDLNSAREVFTAPASLERIYTGTNRLCALHASGARLSLFQIVSAPALRTVRPPSASPLVGYWETVVSEDGRFLACTRTSKRMSKGVALLDARTGRELNCLPLPNARPGRFLPSGELITHGPSGVLLWPLTAGPHQDGAWKLGPPRVLVDGPQLGMRIGASDDGQVLALPSRGQGSWLIHTDRRQPVDLGPQDDVRFCAVSPDGRWVASGSHSSRDVFVKVWDGRTGRPVADLPVQGGSLVAFSPDGRWLATTGGGVRLWKVGSWQEGPKVPGDNCTFSRDGRILAVSQGLGVVRLCNPDTGAEYARWESPAQVRLEPVGFSPDSSLLYFFDTNNALHIWDLRRISTELDSLGLAWDLPLPPPAPPIAAPSAVIIDRGDPAR
jgi:serine/threonine protein kinase/WD40 repeat protein